MTINEAIEFCNEKSKNIKLRTEPKTFEQLAEWLEELKADRIALEKANGYLEANYRLGYSKGIDDFKKILTIEKIKEYAESDGFINLNNCSLMIFDIAEQLKAGNINERN